MSELFVGQITLFPYSYAPLGWADCQGQLLPIGQHSALFSLLGTRFGGNGTSTFGLPDLQGRVAVSQGTPAGGPAYNVGDHGGQETVTLTVATVAPHSHALTAQTGLGAGNSPANAMFATVAKGTLQGRDKGNIYNPGTPNVALVPASVGPSGGDGPHNNMQPSLTLRYCIALTGVFPARP